MKSYFKNGSIIETININPKTIKRSKGNKSRMRKYDENLDHVLKQFDAKWYQKIYLKFIFPIKRKICGKPYIYISSKHHRW